VSFYYLVRVVQPFFNFYWLILDFLESLLSINAPSASLFDLEVRVSNTGAIRFYQKTLNFAVTHTLPKYYGDEDAYRMATTLDYTLVESRLRDLEPDWSGL